MTCEWCGRAFERPHDRGPVPKFCRRSCRQRAFEQRRWERAMTEPSDPLTTFQEGAAQLHEAYQSWVAAGFAPHEALYLCGQILTAGLRKPPEAP